MVPTSAQPRVLKEAKCECSPVKSEWSISIYNILNLLSVCKSTTIIRTKIETIGCKTWGSMCQGEETLCGSLSQPAYHGGIGSCVLPGAGAGRKEKRKELE